MRIGWFRIVALVAVLFGAAESHATSCRQWDGMGPAQKRDTIDRMIGNTVQGSGGRQYHLDRGAVRRCLEGYAQSIQYDFDGACADKRTASMHALNKIFKDYIWNCAG